MKKMIFAASLACAMCAFGDMKVGTVDMMTLLRSHSSYETNKNLLTTTEADGQKKLDKLRDDIEAIQDEGKKVADQMKNPMLAQSKKDQIEKELIDIQNRFVGAQQKLRSEAMRAQQDLQELESRLLKITTDELRGVIDAFAEKNGYDLIIDASAAAYAKKALDITPAVLKELEAEKGKASQDKETVKNEGK